MLTQPIWKGPIIDDDRLPNPTRTKRTTAKLKRCHCGRRLPDKEGRRAARQGNPYRDGSGRRSEQAEPSSSLDEKRPASYAGLTPTAERKVHHQRTNIYAEHGCDLY